MAKPGVRFEHNAPWQPTLGPRQPRPIKTFHGLEPAYHQTYLHQIYAFCNREYFKNFCWLKVAEYLGLLSSTISGC